jgi:hypothetical protein
MEENQNNEEKEREEFVNSSKQLLININYKPIVAQ